MLRRIPSNNSVSPTASLVDVPIQPPSPGASRTIVAPQIPSLSTDTATRRHSLQQTHSVPEPTPTTRTFVDGLRPPGLVHRDRLFTKRLFRAHCVANAISRSGQFVGWFCDDKYEIYELAASETYLACTGKLKKGKYWYGRNKPERKHVDGQMTPGISCAALSDEYIAVGCYGTLLIFTVQGDSPGRWLSSAKFNDVHIEKLVFSPKGDELLAVLKAKDQNGQNSCHKAIVYSSSDFVDDCQQSDEKVKSLRSIEVAEWENSVCEVADAAFSSEGRKIVIGTRHDNRGKSRIMLLKKYPEEGWQKYGDSISLLVRERQDSSAGMNGISLYNSVSFSANSSSFERNKDLVCGLETSFKKASDWHRIKATAGNPTLRPRETTVASDHIRSKILAITVSPLDYNAVALASLGDTSREFLLEFKQQCHEPLSSVVLNFTRTSFQCKLVKPITFSFSDCGTRLILLTGEVSPILSNSQLISGCFGSSQVGDQKLRVHMFFHIAFGLISSVVASIGV